MKSLNNKPKILHIRDSSDFGSPEKLIFEQIKRLKIYFNFNIIIFKNIPILNYKFKKININVSVFSFNLFNLIKTIIFIKNMIICNNISLICSHDYKSNFISLLCGKLCNVPIITVFHGQTSHNFKARFYEYVNKFIIRYFDKIIAVSNATRISLIESGIPNNKIEVIYNATTIPQKTSNLVTEKIRKELRISNEEFVIGFVGRLSREKGLIYLLEALRIILSKKSIRLRLLIVGNGEDYDNIKKQVEKSELVNYVIFTGYRDDIDDIYKAIDLVVLPSLREGMPLVILESFANKKLVIASKVGGIPEIIQDNYSGFLVEKANSNELADKIIFCMNNHDKMKKLINNAYKEFQKKFTYKIQIEKYYMIYKNLLNYMNELTHRSR